MTLRLGIDETGNFVFTGYRFRTTAEDLDRLWARLPATTDITVINPRRTARVTRARSPAPPVPPAGTGPR